jgi:hypothetical protein
MRLFKRKLRQQLCKRRIRVQGNLRQTRRAQRRADIAPVR